MIPGEVIHFFLLLLREVFRCGQFQLGFLFSLQGPR